MIFLRLLLTIALPLLLGLGVVALIYRKEPISFLERTGLAWGIGLGLLGTSMFVLSLAGLRLTLVSSALPALIAAVFLMIYAAVRKYPIISLSSARETARSFWQTIKPSNHFTSLLEKLLVILISLTIIFVFFDARVKPIVNFDDLWRQGCIAKIVYVKGEVINEQAAELAGPHPYLNPLSQAWIYMGIGTWNDALGKIVFALCFTSLIFIFYCGIRRYANRFNSLLFTYLLTSFPLIIYHAGTAYSDLMQTFYYTAGAIFLFHWFKARSNPDLYVSALFLGIGVFVKQLGMPLWIIAMAALAAHLFQENKKKFSPLLSFFLISGLVSLPWLINKNNFIIGQFTILMNKIFPPAANSAAVLAETAAQYGPPTLGGILYHLVRRMFFYADWQILWFVLILTLVFGWQKIWKTELKYLLLILLLDFLMVIYGFTDQAAYNFLVDGTLVQRMLMYQVPVVLFFEALVIYPVIIKSKPLPEPKAKQSRKK